MKNIRLEEIIEGKQKSLQCKQGCIFFKVSSSSLKLVLGAVVVKLQHTLRVQIASAMSARKLCVHYYESVKRSFHVASKNRACQTLSCFVHIIALRPRSWKIRSDHFPTPAYCKCSVLNYHHIPKEHCWLDIFQIRNCTYI